MWYLYVLYSKSFKRSYVGISKCISERLFQHNSGSVISTKHFIPWELIHEENCETELLARRKEKYYKSSAGRRKLKKIFDDLGLNDQ